MTTKEWLSRGWKLDNEINALLSEQKRAFDIACGTTTRISDDKVQASRGNSAETKFINYLEYSKMIDDRIDELYAIKQEILKAINKLEDNTYRTLLIERYINFKTWENIAVDMNYCYKHIVHTLHPKSLKCIKEVIECNIAL